MATTLQAAFNIITGGASIYNAWVNYTQEEKINQHMYIGQVEDNMDPDRRGRVKVRIFGVHTDDKSELPTTDLFWQLVMTPTTSPSISGVGCHPFLTKGATVLLIPDKLDEQLFIVVGTLPTGSAPNGPDEAKGFCDATQEYPRKYNANDRNARATGAGNPDYNNNIYNDFVYDPGSSYAPQYPYNQVFESESGHTNEFDDTPGAERVQLKHKSGTGYEIQPNGNLVTRVKKDNYTLIAGDDTIEVKGSVNIIVSENCNLSVAGDLDAMVDGSLWVTAGDNASINIAGRVGIEAGDEIRINTTESATITSGKDITLKTEPQGYCHSDIDPIGAETYTSRQLCSEAAVEIPDNKYTWRRTNEANIILQSWDNIYMVAHEGEIRMEAKEDIWLKSKEKDIKIQSGEEVSIESTTNTRISAGAPDYVCMNHIGSQVHSATIPASEIKSGTTYNITYPGDTDFTALGADANVKGQTFLATADGVTGTGIVSTILDKDSCEETGVCYIGNQEDKSMTSQDACEVEGGLWFANKWEAGKTGDIVATAENIHMFAWERNDDGWWSGSDGLDFNSVDSRSVLTIKKDAIDLDSKRIDLNKTRP